MKTVNSEKYLENWAGTYKWVYYEIKKWNMDMSIFEEPAKTIWNSYIWISKKDLDEKDFKKFNLRSRKYQITENSPVRYSYDYMKLENYFNFSWGITFYSKEYTSEWKLYAIKFGNDYNHIWNNWLEDLEEVRNDIQNTIDTFLLAIWKKSE